MRCALLAEPHHQLSEGVRGLLEPLFEVIVMVADEASLVDALARMDATIAIVDLSLQPEGGLGMLRRLHAGFPGVTLLAISTHGAPATLRAIAAAGADACVVTGALGRDLVPVVERALGTPKAAAAIAGRTAPRPDR